MKKIKTIRYKGYKIEIISKETALVVCKKCKGQYIPYFNEDGCKICIDHLKSKVTTEKEYNLWDEKEREKAIREEA